MLLTLLLSFMLLLAAIFAIKAAFGYRNVRTEAREDYAYKRAQHMRDANCDEAIYVAAYTKVHGSRGSVYIAAILALNALMTLPILGLLNFLFEFGWRLGGQDRAFEPGYLVWQFMLFGGLIIGWALVTFIAARRYYARMPKSLSAELKALEVF